MELPQEIKDQFGGEPHINIGDPTCAVFVPASIHLLNIMKKYPLMYFAFVEGAKCAEKGFYSAGILTYSQLLKEFSESEPQERHEVAHELLRKQPNKEGYDSIKKQFEEIAIKKMITEFYRHKNREKIYKKELIGKWNALIKTYTD